MPSSVAQKQQTAHHLCYSYVVKFFPEGDHPFLQGLPLNIQVFDGLFANPSSVAAVEAAADSHLNPLESKGLGTTYTFLKEKSRPLWAPFCAVGSNSRPLGVSLVHLKASAGFLKIISIRSATQGEQVLLKKITVLRGDGRSDPESAADRLFTVCQAFAIKNFDIF
ncbi:MAG: hypothetical protein AB7D07_01065 [Desulfovibrionaceae bacterium]|jgi:hypothetical protein